MENDKSENKNMMIIIVKRANFLAQGSWPVKFLCAVLVEFGEEVSYN